MLKKLTNKKDIWIYALGILLFAQLIFIGYMNFLKNDYYLDNDMAKLFVHTMEIVKNRALIIPGWKNTTSLELDSGMFFALPYYIVTKNIYVSYAAAMMTYVGIYVWTIYRICKGDKEKTFLSCILIFIPFGIDFLDYFNMMFFNGAHYVGRVLTVLMLIAILGDENEEKNRKYTNIIFNIIFMAMVFATAISGGVYTFVCGIFPVYAGCISYFLYKRIAVHRKWIAHMITTIGIYAVGYICNVKFQINAKGNDMTLCSLSELKTNVRDVFWGIFELFKAVTYKEDIKALSYLGIGILLKFFFVVMILIALIGIVARIKENASVIDIMCLSAFLWNFFVLCICKTHYAAAGGCEFRYHLIGVIPLMVTVSLFLSQRVCVNFYSKGILFLFLVAINFVVMKDDLDYEPYKVQGLQEICDFVELDDSIHRVYFLNNEQTAEVCRLLDKKGKEYLTVFEDGRMYVLDYYYKYEHIKMSPPDSVFIINTEYHDVGESVSFEGNDYHLIQQIAMYNLYR